MHLVFLQNIPGRYGDFLEKMVNEEKPFKKLEAENFGNDHVELGAKYIEKWWPVSESVVDQIKKHHDPIDTGSKNVFSLANSFVNALGFENKVGPAINEELDFTELIRTSEVELEELKEQTSSSIS